MIAIEQLRTRGGTRVMVDGQVYEIRVLMLRHDPQDVTTEEPVLTLDNAELLVREALDGCGRDVAAAYQTGLADARRHDGDARAEVLQEFSRFLYEKADNSAHDAMSGEEAGYVVGMQNAAVDAGLFLSFRDQWLKTRPPDRGLRCYGCGLPYGDPGWCDVVIPTKYWIQISPNEDGSGVLCLTCMAAALEKKGLRDVPVKITSGPWKFYPGGGGHSRTNATALMEGIRDEVQKLPQFEGPMGETLVPFGAVLVLLHQRGGTWQ